LVQNQVEGAGLSTISMSVQPHITAAVGAPRAVTLRYPAGNQVGEAGKPIQQRTILSWVLQAAMNIREPRTILELPYRWRRFPVVEEPVYAGTSDGARHPHTDEIAATLDTLVRLTQDYKQYLEGRVAAEEASPSGLEHVPEALRDAVVRADRLLQTVDGDAMDQLREIVNRVTVLELMVSGKFV
jgi:D-proline reductase (dithiol) PrdB